MVIEPLPSVEETEGTNGGRYDEGEVTKHLRVMKNEDKRLEGEETDT